MGIPEIDSVSDAVPSLATREQVLDTLVDLGVIVGWDCNPSHVVDLHPRFETWFKLCASSISTLRLAAVLIVGHVAAFAYLCGTAVPDGWLVMLILACTYGQFVPVKGEMELLSRRAWEANRGDELLGSLRERFFPRPSDDRTVRTLAILIVAHRQMSRHPFVHKHNLAELGLLIKSIPSLGVPVCIFPGGHVKFARLPPEPLSP